MGAGKMVAVIVGSLLLLVGIEILFVGGTLIGVDIAFTDDGRVSPFPAGLVGTNKSTCAAKQRGPFVWVTGV